MSEPITWTTNCGDRVEVYATEVGDGTMQRPLSEGFRYRVVARNNRVVETGSEGYYRRAAAVKAAQRHHPVVEP